MRNRLLVPVVALAALGLAACQPRSKAGDGSNPLDTAPIDAAEDTTIPSEVPGEVRCVAQDHEACCGNDLCWVDSCGAQGDVATKCGLGCEVVAGTPTCKQCTPACLAPDGSAKACGADGCGGQCGTCPADKTTCDEVTGKCSPACQD